jgi:hypothetical protein
MSVTNAVNVFNEQNLLTFTVTFTEESTGHPVNPDNVAFGYRVNGGMVTTLIYGVDNVLNTEVGTYQTTIDTTGLAGTWVWEWQSTGSGQASISGSISVVAAPMTLL